MVIRLFVIFFLSCSYLLNGQYDFEPVFRNLEGDELRAAVKQTYTPQNVLTLTQARDTLYRRVYYYQDSVRCIYTGRAKYLNINEDPSQYLFDSGGSTDINLEHSYPRSKGAEFGNASSDMHTLFPSRVDVNADRASDPYNDIPDENTLRWYINSETVSNPDPARINEYSEDNNQFFEPREKVKGNVARAAFYFYTIYEDQANNADPAYFDQMMETLCEWHNNDPVDSLEWERNMIIAGYQDGKANPFILDCSLVRMYCPELASSCQVLPTNDIDRFDFYIYPNLLSVHQTITIEPNYISKGPLDITIMDLSGRTISSHNEVQRHRKIEIPTPQIKGTYIIAIQSKGKLLHTERIIVN